MSAEIYVSARTALFPAGTPIENVKVSLYTAVGVFVSSGLTDVAGNVFLGDRAAATYEIRITPPAPGSVSGGSNRQNITTTDGPALAFDIVVDTSSLPQSPDAAFCRCSGYFINHANQPMRGVPISFGLAETTPHLALETGANTARGIFPDRVEVLTDKNGYASIDLLCGQTYHVQVGGHADSTWDIIVPNALASSLPDVVYPYPNTVEFRDSNATLLLPSASPAVSVLQGVTAEVDLTTVFRSGLSVEGLRGLTMQADTNHWMVGLAISAHKLVITGLSPGVIVMSLAHRAGAPPCYGIRTHPAQTFLGNLVITVTDDAGIPDLVDPADGTLGGILYDNAD